MHTTSVNPHLSRIGLGRLVAVAALFLTLGAGQGFGDIADACGTTTWTLWAGQTIDVGTVTVSNDADNVYVTYTLTYDPNGDGVVDGYFGTLHLWIGNDLSLLPRSGGGNPNPGQFCDADGGACYTPPDNTTTTHTFTMPFSELSITNVQGVCGKTLFVVTHAEANVDSDGDGTIDPETAFGGDKDGDTGNRWWFYAEYTICCDNGEPDPPFCQTAFAKGDWVWTTMKRANPEGLGSLKLTKARWGWAIELTEIGETTYDIWAGAGLNDTDKGTLVGTLTVNWDGTDVVVTYDMEDGYYLEEVHLYAGATSPTTIAPGQYGNLEEFDPNVASHEFDVPLADSDGDGSVWLVAHAVVCDEQ